MKRLITIFAVFSLACLSAGMVYAESTQPAGYNIIDFVNIGDTAGDDTEGGRNMTEWGPSFDAGIWFGPENSEYYRQIWGWTTPPAGYPAGTDSENWAEIDLDFTKPAYTGQLNIGFFFLAGSGIDNFNVYIDGTLIGTVTEIQTNNTMMREFLAVPAWVTTGSHTVKLECAEPAWGSQATYGQVTIDEVYTFTDPLIDPIIDPIAVDGNPINCSGTKLVNFHYAPGINPEVRGYTVRVSCDASLTFDEDDVAFNTVPTGVTTFPKVTVVTAGQVYDVDYAILGGSVGISAAADLFSVTFHGAGTGTGVVSMVSADLRDLDNIFITPVVSDGTVGIPVDCTPPDIPVMVGEPEFTQGLTNTVNWSDVSATSYYAECATDAGFTALVGNSGWIAGLSHEFTGLMDGQIYYYRVKAVDDLDNESGWSNVESSTQDATAPVTKVTALDQFQVDSFFDVSYEIELPEDGSDFTKVELFYKKTGDPDWILYDVFVDLATPLVFETGAAGLNRGDGTYYFYSKGTDHVDNEEQPPTSFPPGSDYDTFTTVDTSDLVVNYFLINGGDTYTSNTLVELTMDVPDAVDMQFSNDGTNWSGWVTFTSPYPWNLTTGEDTKTVYAHFREIPSYRVTDAQDDIILDITPPDGITGLSAERGLEKVKLTWTNNGGVGQTGVEMWRAVWRNDDDGTSAYPEYDDLDNDVIPTVPADRAAAALDPAWTEVDLSSETYPFAAFDDLLTDRGIYYYVVYPVDGAGLYGDGDDDSSISYLLGDLQLSGDPPVYDGTVLGGDITILGTAYGTTHAGGGTYNNECDVGPTDDYSGSGTPATDNFIDFDDLMIFALNWNITPLTKAQPAEGSLIARFSWVEVDDTTWSLVLTEPCANLKGVNLKANLPQDATLSVTPGSLLGQQDCSYFLKNIPDNGLDAGMALLGNGASITGQGELIRISLTGEFDPGDILIVARDMDNKDLDFSLEETTADADIPTRYMLSANYPNPFNPSTKIEFALPEAQHVRLAIFAVDGRRIATLKNESMSAGHHSVIWTGRDDRDGLVSAGIYFYRIQAGDFIQTQKMTLVK